MAIAKRPNSNQADIDAFIAGAVPPAVKKPVNDDKRVATVVRVPAGILAKIDAAARSRGVSRAAFMTMAAARAVEMGEL
jgi:hypothetical protein